MKKLLLIRHSHPQVEPDRPPGAWNLSDEGVRGAERLAAQLTSRNIHRIFTSTEQKAIQTGEICAAQLGITCSTRRGLEEQLRTGVGYLERDVFLRGIRDLFLRPRDQVMGIETGHEAAERLDRTILQLKCELPDERETLACVSHGTIMSLYAAQSANIDGLDLWQRLGMPATISIDLTSNEILEVTESY
jgi:2,3-bisphosphoglycerate-dependent phosphoglycerate mutase